METQPKFEDLKGRVLTAVKVDDEHVHFVTDSGEHFRLWHSQDCCEHVYVESVVGDVADLIGHPILMADEATNGEQNPSDAKPELTGYQDSFTWTFYRLATIKGGVTIRFYGSSNGYYSESVDFARWPA